jgi:hypothetical protein
MLTAYYSLRRSLFMVIFWSVLGTLIEVVFVHTVFNFPYGSPQLTLWLVLGYGLFFLNLLVILSIFKYISNRLKSFSMKILNLMLFILISGFSVKIAYSILISLINSIDLLPYAAGSDIMFALGFGGNFLPAIYSITICLILVGISSRPCKTLGGFKTETQHCGQ